MTDSDTQTRERTETTSKEQGPTEGVTPHLTIPDKRAAAAIEFYKQAFAASEQMAPVKADDGERILHANLKINGGYVMLNDDFPEYGGGMAGAPVGVTLHLHVDDADRWFERATKAGATVTMPLADQFWGDRYGQVKDPFGHSWSIGAPIRK